jgi:hypothetical protein
MNPLAKMGIPNLAEPERCDKADVSWLCQNWPSILAVTGNQHGAAGRQIEAGTAVAAPTRDFPLPRADGIPRKARDCRATRDTDRVAGPFFYVVQLRTVLVVTPIVQAPGSSATPRHPPPLPPA